MRLAPEIRTHLDRFALQSACRLVRSEPAVAAMTIALSRPSAFAPGELECFCAELAEDEGVEIEILEGVS